MSICIQKIDKQTPTMIHSNTTRSFNHRLFTMSRKIVGKVLSAIGAGALASALVTCVSFELSLALGRQLENYSLRKKLLSNSRHDIRDGAIETKRIEREWKDQLVDEPLRDAKKIK
jgi:hypothetical protein